MSCSTCKAIRSSLKGAITKPLQALAFITGTKKPAAPPIIKSR